MRKGHARVQVIPGLPEFSDLRQLVSNPTARRNRSLDGHVELRDFDGLASLQDLDGLRDWDSCFQGLTAARDETNSFL